MILNLNVYYPNKNNVQYAAGCEMHSSARVLFQLLNFKHPSFVAVDHQPCYTMNCMCVRMLSMRESACLPVCVCTAWNSLHTKIYGAAKFT